MIGPVPGAHHLMDDVALPLTTNSPSDTSKARAMRSVTPTSVGPVALNLAEHRPADAGGLRQRLEATSRDPTQLPDSAAHSPPIASTGSTAGSGFLSCQPR